MVGVVLLLQAAAAVYIGIDNLNVVRHVDWIIQGLAPCKPSELLKNGDLLVLLRLCLKR